jgi:hypothetical protein
MIPPVILALDPGLDCTGWAVFRTPAHHLATLQDYAPCLVGSGYVQTKPDSRPDHLQIPARVDQMVSELKRSIDAVYSLGMFGPIVGDVVLIEVPAIYGPYASRGPQRQAKALGMARSMAVLWYTIGRLEGTFGTTAQVIPIKASGDKRGNHATVLMLWPDLPTRTRPSEDQRDAVSLGLRYLIDRRRVSIPRPPNPPAATDSAGGGPVCATTSTTPQVRP